ncbi:MAG TPA: ABC transporter ATP-binding protein [Gammaproteobacteria bacterium]|nr:ABC transporter ATP-binding protein [Gammaproteobacteria bacterium]
MNVLEIEGLHARYGKHEVLKGVSLEVQRGHWFCLLGPNGVGKSTLLHCVAGRLAPARGDIRIAGRSLAASPREAKARLGFACAPDQLPPLLTGRQCLEVYAIAKELETIDADVLELAGRLKFAPFLDGFVDTYSLGTRQKLCVLLALLGDPALVVLDEAFNGLDPRSALVLKRHLEDRLASRRCGVLLATHSLDVVERHADEAALLLEGALAERWSRDDIERLKSLGADALERALAEAASA